MNTLVTGGAGFIGSHLVERLLKDGHNVIVLDNFSTGRYENLTRENFTQDTTQITTQKPNMFPTKNRICEKMCVLFKPWKLKVVKIDITTSLSKLHKYFVDVDWVFHLAALADIVPSISYPLAYHKTNVDGTINILEVSRQAKIKRFIYAASSSCYGKPTEFPTPETALIQPQYPYALTKFIAEQYILHWGKVYKLPVMSLRLFNVYGPRSRTSGTTYGAVFGVFLAQKLANQPFTVVGDGTQSRDFTFVTDVVNALVMTAKSSLTNETLNVGTGKPKSLNTLVKLLGGKSIHIPKRPGEPDKTQADISKIKRLLKWQPQVSFEKGVKIMLDNIGYWKSAPLWTSKKIKEATKEWFKYL